jgi:GNAT superfamily N-acetyltransferase
VTILVRRVRDLDELVATFDAIGRQFDPPMSAPDRRLDEPIARFAEDRTLSLMAFVDERLSGGVIAFRRPDGHSLGVRAIGIDDSLRGLGVGRLLLELVELEALAMGCREISLGAAVAARGFYEALGYRGKHTMRAKSLPPPSRLTERLVATRRAALGDPDLDGGFVYEALALAGSSTTKAEPGSARS